MMMISAETLGSGAWHRVATTQNRIRQTRQIAGEYPPLAYPLPMRRASRQGFPVSSPVFLCAPCGSTFFSSIATPR